MFRAFVDVPAFVITRLVWDETGQVVSLRMPGMTNEQLTNTWQIRCARLFVHIGWLKEDGTAEVFRLMVAFPPPQSFF